MVYHRKQEICDKQEREGILRSFLNSAMVALSRHELDEGLTLLWANDAFYDMMQFDEKNTSPLQLKSFYEKDLDDFNFLRTQLHQLEEENKQSMECMFRLPQNENGRAWVKAAISIEINEDNQKILTIVYHDVNDLMQVQNTLSKMNEERTKNFEWMMSEYGGNVYISDIHTYELLFLNKVACETLGIRDESEAVGKKCYQVIQGRTSPCPFCTNAMLKKDETYQWEFYNPVLQRTFLIHDRMLNWKGHAARIELSYDMYSAEYKLAKKDQEREAILQTIPAGMIRVDARDYSTVLWHNGIFLEMIGYTEEQFETELHNQCTYMDENDLKRAQLLVQDLKQSGENVVLEARITTREGKKRIWTITLCYISGKDSWDGIPSFYSMGLDITEERQEIETLQHKAEKDALTNIYNRSETENQIKDYIINEPNSLGALFMIDTDNFKIINDTRGHIAGDLVLCELASGMQNLMRESDVVGRIGGDEFTIFMKNIVNIKDVERKANELVEMFRHLFDKSQENIHVTCSLGVAVYPKDGHTFKELYANADRALYQAKLKGKNTYVIYDESCTATMEDISSSTLGTAIDSERQYEESSDNLARYIFRILYDTKDIDEAINTILEIVGKRYGVSRAYVCESSRDGMYCSNTYEWCKEGVEAMKSSLQQIAYKDIGDYDHLFDDNSIFYCRDVYSLNEIHRDLFLEQGIHSTLQCGYWDEDRLAGFIGFDECTGQRFWTMEEVSTLSLISQILSIFLKQNELIRHLHALEKQIKEM